MAGSVNNVGEAPTEKQEFLEEGQDNPSNTPTALHSEDPMVLKFALLGTKDRLIKTPLSVEEAQSMTDWYSSALEDLLFTRNETSPKTPFRQQSNLFWRVTMNPARIQAGLEDEHS